MVKGEEKSPDMLPPKTIDISIFKIKGVIKGDKRCDKNKANQVKFRIEISLVEIYKIAQYFFHLLKFYAIIDFLVMDAFRFICAVAAISIPIYFAR